MYIGTLPVVSNKATFNQSFTVIDDETGTGFDITNATIKYEIRDPASLSSLLTATNDDGIDLSSAVDGIFTVSFTASQMGNLCGKEYDVGCTVEIADEISQFFVARQPVIDGVVI